MRAYLTARKNLVVRATMGLIMGLSQVIPASAFWDGPQPDSPPLTAISFGFTSTEGTGLYYDEVTVAEMSDGSLVLVVGTPGEYDEESTSEFQSFEAPDGSTISVASFNPNFDIVNDGEVMALGFVSGTLRKPIQTPFEPVKPTGPPLFIVVPNPNYGLPGEPPYLVIFVPSDGRVIILPTQNITP